MTEDSKFVVNAPYYTYFVNEQGNVTISTWRYLGHRPGEKISSSSCDRENYFYCFELIDESHRVGNIVEQHPSYRRIEFLYLTWQELLERVHPAAGKRSKALAWFEQQQQITRYTAILSSSVAAVLATTDYAILSGVMSSFTILLLWVRTSNLDQLRKRMESESRFSKHE
jgi:hypothetical protein